MELIEKEVVSYLNQKFQVQSLVLTEEETQTLSRAKDILKELHERVAGRMIEEHSDCVWDASRVIREVLEESWYREWEVSL